MISTKQLYGITSLELASKIGLAVNNAIYDTRIKILKKNLKKVTDKNAIDPNINHIIKAINHWQKLKEFR